jgi:hypothetical protein
MWKQRRKIRPKRGQLVFLGKYLQANLECSEPRTGALLSRRLSGVPQEQNFSRYRWCCFVVVNERFQ